jgi:23S rRNA (guanosine2251-2'-O)-methyltransferase
MRKPHNKRYTPDRKQHRPINKKLKGDVHGEVVIGRRAVAEILRYVPSDIERLLVTNSEATDRVLGDLCATAKAAHIEIVAVRIDELTRIAGSESHQGIVALLRPIQFATWQNILQIPETDPALVLLVDGVQDPQNFGAILRTAECFGVAAVIWSRNRSSGITPVVSKSACGATRLLPLIEIANLRDSALKLREVGFWWVVADGTPGAIDMRDFEFPKRTALIVGSEGEGVQPLIRKEADFVVSIPMFGKIESLNVAQATAVLLSEYRRQMS